MYIQMLGSLAAGGREVSKCSTVWSFNVLILLRLGERIHQVCPRHVRVGVWLEMEQEELIMCFIVV